MKDDFHFCGCIRRHLALLQLSRQAGLPAGRRAPQGSKRGSPSKSDQAGSTGRLAAARTLSLAWDSTRRLGRHRTGDMKTGHAGPFSVCPSRSNGPVRLPSSSQRTVRITSCRLEKLSALRSRPTCTSTVHRRHRCQPPNTIQQLRTRVDYLLGEAIRNPSNSGIRSDPGALRGFPGTRCFTVELDCRSAERWRALQDAGAPAAWP